MTERIAISMASCDTASVPRWGHDLTDQSRSSPKSSKTGPVIINTPLDGLHLGYHHVDPIKLSVLGQQILAKNGQPVLQMLGPALRPAAQGTNPALTCVMRGRDAKMLDEELDPLWLPPLLTKTRWSERIDWPCEKVRCYRECHGCWIDLPELVEWAGPCCPLPKTVVSVQRGR